MAKTDAEGATPEKGEKGAKKPRKTFKKRGEKRIVHSGYAHIHASFNNTMITITDVDGNVIASASRDRARARRSRRLRRRLPPVTRRRPSAFARLRCA
jgi:hypothetical protein